MRVLKITINVFEWLLAGLLVWSLWPLLLKAVAVSRWTHNLGR